MSRNGRNLQFLFFCSKKTKGISSIIDLCELILLTTRGGSTFVGAVSQSGDYISSVTVSTLSAEGINWPTSARLHNHLRWFTSQASFECVCVHVSGCVSRGRGALSQNQLCYLTWAIRVKPKCPISDWKTDLFSGCWKILNIKAVTFSTTLAQRRACQADQFQLASWLALPPSRIKRNVGMSLIQAFSMHVPPKTCLHTGVKTLIAFEKKKKVDAICKTIFHLL